MQESTKTELNNYKTLNKTWTKQIQKSTRNKLNNYRDQQNTKQMQTSTTHELKRYKINNKMN